MMVSLSKLSSFSFVYFKAILPPPGIQVILLYQNPAGFANPAVSGIRHNAHIPGFAYGFCRTAFLRCFQMELIYVLSVKAIFQAYIPGCMLPGCASLGSVKATWKFLCFAQDHPIYSGGSTGLTDFSGVIVSPSISQRNCCGVNERTSSLLRGHWNRLSDKRLYNNSHPSPSHTRPLMRSVRRPQKR